MGKVLDKMNASSKQAWSSAWKSGNIGGTLGSLTSGLTSVVGAGLENAKIKDTSAEEAAIDRVENTLFSEGSYDNLMSEFDATNMARNNFTQKEVRGLNGWQMAGNTLKGAASGAMTGAKVGGIWGGVAGFLGGTAAELLGIASGDKKARNKAIALNNDAMLANNTMLNNFSNSVENTQNTMFNNSLLNIASYGGPLFNHSGDWTNGLTFINAGGTHEQNPFEGVQVGVDPQGTPNLVEEGEIIYNDYVFSNRLKPTKKQLEDSGLNKKYEGWTFAKIVEDLQKESADNPIDFISQNTLEDMISIVIKMQEEIRMKKAKNTKDNMFDIGGKKKNKSKNDTVEDLKKAVLEHDYYVNQLGYSSVEEGKRIQKINKLEEELGISSNTSDINFINNIVNKFTKNKNYNTGRKAENNKFDVGGPFTSKAEELEADRIQAEEDARMDILSNTLANKVRLDNGLDLYFPSSLKEATTIEDEISTKNKFNWQSLGRYAPVLADATTLMTNLFTKPDYSNANAGVKAMRDVPMVDVKPVGNYIQLDNLDRNYYLNPLLASSRSTARAIQNQGLNAGQTQFALLANQHELNKATGNALMEMERENMARDLQEAQFNLGIDQYNANQAMQARQMNQQRAYNIAQAEANAAQMREAIDAQRTAAISQGLSNLSDNLSGIGTESVYRDWLGALTDTEALQDVFGAAANARKTKKACGGRMLTKKRK